MAIKDYEKLSLALMQLGHAVGRPFDRIDLDEGIVNTMTQDNIDDMTAYIVLSLMHSETPANMYSVIVKDLKAFGQAFIGEAKDFVPFTKGYMEKLRWVHEHKKKGGKK